MKRPLVASSTALCLIAVLAPVSQTLADDSTAASDLKSLSLDQLLNVEVTSVNRHPEKLQQTASAIQVITQEDIRRSGATSIPEALRLADNLEVAQKNAHDWAISARGFNTALGNKLLVMIDGRTVYTPLYSGVFWDVQDYPLADIDRIEVISGPGGTLWGANAVNGVINIITKSAADTRGAYVDGGGGNELQSFGDFRYGGELSDNTQYRLYGTYFDRSGELLPTGLAAGDGWHQGQGGFRLDSQPSPQDSLSIHGDVYSGREGIETGSDAQTHGSNLVGKWTRVVSDQSDVSLQLYYDRTHLLDPIPAYVINGIPLSAAGNLQDDLSTYDVDFQQRWALTPRHNLVWGWGFRYTRDLVQDAPSVAFLPNVLDQSLYSAFLQDEIALRQNLQLIIGSKFEHNDYTGFEYEPNARLQWSMSARDSLWGAVSRAARTPSRIDRDFYEPAPPSLVVLEGGREFGSEYVIAYELGYRVQFNSKTVASISSYYNQYDDVRSTSLTPTTLLPFYFANNLEGHTYGIEFSGNYQILEDWTVHAGYDLLREHLHVKPGTFDLSNALNETSDPEHQVSIRSSVNLAHHTQLDAAWRWVDTLLTNNGPTPGRVPAYCELDLRVGWQPSDRLDLSIVGQNLLHDHHPEYGFPSPLREEIARSVLGKVTWRF